TAKQSRGQRQLSASEQGSNIAVTHVLKIMRRRCGRKRNGAHIPEFKTTKRSKPNETIPSHCHAPADHRDARDSWHRQDNDGGEIPKSSIHPDRGRLPEWVSDFELWIMRQFRQRHRGADLAG